MAIPNTYEGILEQAQAVMSETGQDFVDYIPTAISLATDRLDNDTDFIGNSSERSTATTTSGTRTLDKPIGWEYTRNIFLELNDGTEKLLSMKPDDYIRDFWPNPSTTGVPIYYGNWSQTELILAPTPDDTYTVHFNYGAGTDPVDATTSTNIYTDYCPDVYFKAVLIECAMFLKLYSQVDAYVREYITARDIFNNKGRRSRREDGHNNNNPENTQNTLTDNPDETVG